jgi:energy-coupling factor transporter ATP-binding protein EcfA2
MNLKKIIVKNFRGYKGEHVFEVDENLTTLIGKNDAGKSTLLEALEIFFGDAKPELGDLNIHADAADREMLFGCVFSSLPSEITVDSSATTTLADEYLLNENGDFEVIVRFTCTEKTVSTKPETIIRAIHPTVSEYDDLLKLKLPELKARGVTLGVSVADMRVNSQWRKAIWEHAGNLEVQKVQLTIEEFDSKAKAIYTNLSALFPQYYIFKVDRQTSDGDAEAKDPMQLAVKEAQKEYQADIAALQAKIQTRVDEVADRALSKLHEMDASLASKLSPVLKSTPKWTFDYKIEDDRGVSINRRGSGTRRLVLLNFFRAEAERKSLANSGGIVYAIEEPETSQHPNNQKMVIDSLLELSKDSKRQVVLTTHSPQLMDSLPTDSIRYVEFDDTAKDVTIHEGESALAKAADSLGILSNQRLGSARAVVIVEGESDELFLTHAANTLASDGHIASNLSDAKILILPAGSCDNVPFWVQKRRLEELGLPYAIFIDSDRMNATDPNTKNEQFCTTLRASGAVAVTTKKREIENYIDPSISGAIYGDYDDAKLIIATANSMLRMKSKVFGKFWPTMTSAQIISNSTYTDAGIPKVEIVDILNEILSI